MVRALLIGWLLMGLVAQVWGGPPGGRVDSLVRALQVAADDAARQRVLLELAYEYSLSKPREGQRYAKQALALARTRGDAAGLTKIYLQLGQLASNENDIEEARGWYEKALALARTRGDSVAMGVSQANLANYYCNTGDNRKALDLAFAVTRGGARPGRERAMVLAYTVIGRVHDLQGDRLRARAYYLKALAAAGPEDAGARESSLFNLGLVSATLDSPAAALRYFERSGEIARQEGDTGQLGLVFLGKGQVYEQNLRDLPRAVAHYRQGLEVFRRIGDSVNLAQAALAVAVVQRLQGRAGAAVPLLEEALGIARRSGVAPVQLAVQEELHANAEARGDLAKALAHYRAYVKLNDSLRNSENDRHLAQLESQYEFAEKNKKIALLSAERRVQEKQVALQRLVTYGLLVGLVLVLGV
ncbi:MAG TPA: tetratricopeptide repeat protein, partial [bacterium]|nr:tetratricopeptide repeat protein [bacterium]